VIFRWLYRRRLKTAFGAHIPRSSPVWDQFQVSELQALKSFLPDRWFCSKDEIAKSYRDVARMSAQILHERGVDTKP
jgi:hypothetical protein